MRLCTTIMQQLREAIMADRAMFGALEYPGVFIFGRQLMLSGFRYAAAQKRNAQIPGDVESLIEEIKKGDMSKIFATEQNLAKVGPLGPLGLAIPEPSDPSAVTRARELEAELLASQGGEDLNVARLEQFTIIYREKDRFKAAKKQLVSLAGVTGRNNKNKQEALRARINFFLVLGNRLSDSLAFVWEQFRRTEPKAKIKDFAEIVIGPPKEAAPFEPHQKGSKKRSKSREASASEDPEKASEQLQRSKVFVDQGGRPELEPLNKQDRQSKPQNLEVGIAFLE